LIRPGTTKLLLEWEGTPQPRLEHHPNRGEIEVIFEGAVLGQVQAELNVSSPEVRSLHLTEDPDILQVRAVVSLPSPTSVEAFFLASSHQYVLILRADRSASETTYGLPESISEEDRAFLTQHLVGIDPSHGGGDTGSTSMQEHTEKAFVLAFAQDLKKLCEQTGLTTEMVRDDDRLVPMHTRVHQLNRARCSVVLSLHARSQQPEIATTSPILFLLPLATESQASLSSSTEVAENFPELSSLRSPNARERSEAKLLADLLQRTFASKLHQPTIPLYDPSLLPQSLVLAPSLSIDLGPIEHFATPGSPGFERDPARRRLAFACYQGLLDYFHDLRLRTPPPLPAALGSTVSPPSPTGLQQNIMASPDYTAPEFEGEP
jgi:N-acetylmuramoyl-L-alanine amidase